MARQTTTKPADTAPQPELKIEQPTEEQRQAMVKAVRQSMTTGGAIKPIVPQDFDQAYRMAQIIFNARMSTKSLDTVEKIAVSIMFGLELGLTPMASVQSIAVINGTPSIWGDGMLALVRSTGQVEDVQEEVTLDDDGSPLQAVCKVKRKGSPSWVVGVFTRVDAQRAGLWRKEGPWQTYPQRMMLWRARSWAYRAAFPDRLKGISIAEEAFDMVDVGSGTAAPDTPEPSRADYKPAKRGKADAADVPFEEAPPEERRRPVNETTEQPGEQQLADTQADEPVDVSFLVGADVLGEANIIKAIERMIGDAPDAKTVDAIMTDNAPKLAKFSPVKRAAIEKHADDHRRMVA